MLTTLRPLSTDPKSNVVLEFIIKEIVERSNIREFCGSSPSRLQATAESGSESHVDTHSSTFSVFINFTRFW
jgi:hypothetical protein